MTFDFSVVTRVDAVRLSTRAEKPALPDVSMVSTVWGARGSKQLLLTLSPGMYQALGGANLWVSHNRSHDVLIVEPHDEGDKPIIPRGGRALLRLDHGDFVEVDERQTPEFHLDVDKKCLFVKVPPAFRGVTPARVEAPQRVADGPAIADFNVTTGERIILKLLLREGSVSIDVLPGALGVGAADVPRILRKFNLKLASRKASITVKQGVLALVGGEKIAGLLK